MIIFTFLCLGIILYFLLRRDPRLKYYLNQIGGPSSLPVLGNALSTLQSDPLTLMEKWNRQYGRVYSIWIGNFAPCVMITDPDVAEKVLSTMDHIEKGKHFKSMLHDWLGLGLGTAPKEKWTQRRKLITPAFNFKILGDFLRVFNDQASMFLKCLKRDSRDSGDTFNMFPYISNLTLDIICETAMGLRVDAQTGASCNNKKYIDALNCYAELVSDKVIKPWLCLPFLYRLLSRNYKVELEYLRTLKDFTNQVIQTRKVERQTEKLCAQVHLQSEESLVTAGGKKRKAFLDLLLDISEEDPQALPETDIQDEVDTFMFAGSDTASVSLGWTIHLLANHPECQKQVQWELDRIFSDDPSRDVTLADISDMRYIECCIKESLRLYPSGPVIMRQVDCDIPMKNGKIIPKGATAIIGIYCIHRHTDYYDDPNAFKPERFSREGYNNDVVKKHAYSFIPFSAGPRNCPGQKFAMMEMKTVLAKLLRKYWIEPVDKMEDLRKMVYIVLKCDNGVRVKLHNRH